MAISKIKKIEIIGLKEDKERILGLLQKLGLVELISIQESAAKGIRQVTPSDNLLLEIEDALSYSASFQEKSGLLKGMIRIKPVVYEQQLKEVIANYDYSALLKELLELRNRLKNISQHREHLVQEQYLLIPWRKLKIALDELYYSKNCGIIPGVLRSADYTNLLEDCQKENINLFCQIISQDRTNTHLVILYLKKDFEHLEILLKNRHFNFVTLGRHKGTVENRLLEVNREILVLDDQMQETKDKITKLSREHFNLMIIYDYLSNIKNRREIEKDLLSQKYTFSLNGWIKEKDIAKLERAIANNFKDVAIFISEPRACEELPVDLENPCLLQPFEFITKIYGFPKYNELDPTPFLAPFFFLYFGFCVSDVGYGFILACLSLFILKKFRLGPQGLRFFRLFFFCGISTIIIGALTGSWFGNLFDLLAQGNKIFLPLKKFKDALVIIDPLKEPTKLLGIALSFGIIQVWFGNIVAGIGNLKNKRYLDILLDQVPMLTFLFGLTGFGLIFLKLLDKSYINLFNYSALSAGLMLILTQGRSEKGLGGKLFYGVYNLYSALSGYLSDILSYSRLWALGLVTSVMASTINLISIQFSQIFVSIIPFIDKIGFIKVLVSAVILIIIFVFGHLVSFLMNLLGAFVHPLRLQFVEFFSKFFKAGGNSFQPFKLETKYTTFD